MTVVVLGPGFNLGMGRPLEGFSLKPKRVCDTSYTSEENREGTSNFSALYLNNQTREEKCFLPSVKEIPIDVIRYKRGAAQDRTTTIANKSAMAMFRFGCSLIVSLD